jgi:hypothetical protein
MMEIESPILKTEIKLSTFALIPTYQPLLMPTCQTKIKISKPGSPTAPTATHIDTAHADTTHHADASVPASTLKDISEPDAQKSENSQESAGALRAEDRLRSAPHSATNSTAGARNLDVFLTGNY